MKRLFVSGIVLAAAAVAGCDPCAGTSVCGSTAPRLVIDGQIVQARDGRGVDGVRLEVHRTGGATLASDDLSAVTAGGGFWRVTAPATGSGDVIVDVTVASPLVAHPYVVRGVRVPTVTRDGDAFFADRWVADPYYPYYGEFYRRGRPDSLITFTPIVFRQTGGPLLRGAAADSTVQSSTDAYGRAQLFLYNAFASDTGAVVGDATLELRAPYAPTVVRGISLLPAYLYRAPGIVPRYGAGPSLEYSAAIFDRATGKTIPGVRMDFRRVSGIHLDPESFGVKADEFGYTHFHTVAMGTGNVVADITLYPPYGDPETFRDTIPTFDSDVPRLLANWSAGAVFPYYGIVRSFGKNLSGVPVRVRRTGGVAIATEDTVVLTRDDGVLQLSPRPLGSGQLVLELTFTPPPPYPRFIVRNVVISTVQRDTPGINVWTWDLERGITGPPGTEVVIVP